MESIVKYSHGKLQSCWCSALQKIEHVPIVLSHKRGISVSGAKSVKSKKIKNDIDIENIQRDSLKIKTLTDLKEDQHLSYIIPKSSAKFEQSIFY